jgi:hypothetical protein
MPPNMPPFAVKTALNIVMIKIWVKIKKGKRPLWRNITRKCIVIFAEITNTKD